MFIDSLDVVHDNDLQSLDFAIEAYSYVIDDSVVGSNEGLLNDMFSKLKEFLRKLKTIITKINILDRKVDSNHKEVKEKLDNIDSKLDKVLDDKKDKLDKISNLKEVDKSNTVIKQVQDKFNIKVNDEKLTGLDLRNGVIINTLYTSASVIFLNYAGKEGENYYRTEYPKRLQKLYKDPNLENKINDELNHVLSFLLYPKVIGFKHGVIETKDEKIGDFTKLNQYYEENKAKLINYLKESEQVKVLKINGEYLSDDKNLKSLIDLGRVSKHIAKSLKRMINDSRFDSEEVKEWGDDYIKEIKSEIEKIKHPMFKVIKDEICVLNIDEKNKKATYLKLSDRSAVSEARLEEETVDIIELYNTDFYKLLQKMNDRINLLKKAGDELDDLPKLEVSDQHRETIQIIRYVLKLQRQIGYTVYRTMREIRDTKQTIELVDKAMVKFDDLYGTVINEAERFMNETDKKFEAEFAKLESDISKMKFTK